VEHTCIKKTIILKAADISAVQMLKFIGSFYRLYKALNTHYDYKSTVHVHVNVWYCKMCIFVVLCVDETYFMREYSDAITITKCNLQSRARTHSVLGIGLYELLDPTT
jgi:hypothetical protein